MGSSEKLPAMVLTPENYAIWKIKILDRLYIKKLAKPIEKKGIKPEKIEEEEWEELDRSGELGEARMGNNGTSKIEGIGDIWLQNGSGRMLELKNVRHIPDLRMNLISTGQLDDAGYTNSFGNGKWNLTKQGSTILTGNKEGTLYIHKVPERFNMADCKPVNCPLGAHFKLINNGVFKQGETDDMSTIPYSSAVGSLMYAMICTRPDIAYTVGVLSRYLSRPGHEHWEAVKWLLRYLKCTASLSLCYGRGGASITGYSDADMAGDLDTKRSTSGYLFTYGGGAISWQSKRQKCVALSTTEAEYIAVTEACKEMMWLKRLCKEIGITQDKFCILCDSQSAIHLSKNLSFHSKSKHIHIRYHWIRDVLDEKELELEKVSTDDNGSDMMTKILPRGKHEVCCNISGLEIVQDTE